METTSSGVFKELELNPKLDYPFSTRIMVQRKILESADKVYCGAREVFITDRTPLDMLAYTLADVTRQNMDDKLEKEIESYTNDCYEILNRHFSVVTLVQPGIPLIDETGKAPASPAHMEHISNLIFGLLVGSRFVGENYYIPRHVTDIEERMEALLTAVTNTEEAHERAFEEGGIIIH